MQQFLSLSVIAEARSRQARFVRPRQASVVVFEMLEGRGEIGGSLPTFALGALREALPVAGMLYLFMKIVLFGLIAPIVFSAFYFLRMLFQAIFSFDLNVLEMVSCIFSLAAMLMAILYFLFFVLPIPFVKNTFYIRWGVLAGLTNGDLHPQASKWLNEE